jgi:hypothetical protein
MAKKLKFAGAVSQDLETMDGDFAMFLNAIDEIDDASVASAKGEQPELEVMEIRARHILPKNVYCYKGETLNGIPHGRGTMYFFNGSTYEGEINNGKIQGQGTSKYAKSGAIRSGNFLNGRLHGYGKIESTKLGTCKEGQIAYGIPYGYTIFTSMYGDEHEGFINPSKEEMNSIRQHHANAQKGVAKTES